LPRHLAAENSPIKSLDDGGAMEDSKYQPNFLVHIMMMSSDGDRRSMTAKRQSETEMYLKFDG